jgi:hypothetical protein
MNDWDENQGRGPKPSLIASGLDWLLAVLIGTCLALALVAWCDEASPAFTAQVSK